MARNSRSAIEALRIILPIAILAVGIGGFILLKSAKKAPASATPENKTPVVETVRLRRHEGDIKIVVSGEVVPYREVNIVAEVAGRITRKEPICETGTYVELDDVLFKIDDQDYQLEEQRLQKELEQSQAYINELDEEIEGTLRRLQVAGQEVASQEAEYNRQVKLQGVVSDSQISKAKRDWLAAQNAEIQIRNQQQLLAARKLRLTSAAELAGVQLQRAKLDVDRTTIRSPVTGVITGEHVQQDAYVQKGETLLTIEDTSQAEITCQLDAEDEQWIWLSHPELLRKRNLADEPARDYELPATPAKVIYRRGDLAYQWDGLLTRYDGLGFDPETRTIPCRVVVSKPREEAITAEPAKVKNLQLAVGPRALVRGMYVTVELFTSPQVSLFRVPVAAIQPGGRLWTVREEAVDEGGKPIPEGADKRVIRTKLKMRTAQIVGQVARRSEPDDDDKELDAIVFSPDGSLQENDLVVISPLSNPRDNQPVQLSRGVE